MKWLELEFKGKTVRIPAEKRAGRLWFHWQGETFSYEPPRKSKGKSGGAATEPGKILAPMPGKIIKCLAREGDPVSSGQVVLVMEAMKMEYTLSSDIDGVLKSLRCSEGDQVTLEQELAVVEES